MPDLVIKRASLRRVAALGFSNGGYGGCGAFSL